MIAFDTSPSINLQPIYNSLNSLSSRIASLSGDKIYTNMTYNYNFSTADSLHSVDLDANSCLISGDFADIQNKTTTLNQAKFNIKGIYTNTIKNLSLKGSGDGLFSLKNIATLSANTFSTFANYINIDYVNGFSNNYMYHNNGIIADFKNIKYLQNNSFSLLKYANIDNISIMNSNSFSNCSCLNFNNINGAYSNRVTAYMFNAKYGYSFNNNNIYRARDLNIKNFLTVSTCSIYNGSHVKIDEIRQLLNNQIRDFNEVELININNFERNSLYSIQSISINAALLKMNTIGCENLKVNFITPKAGILSHLKLTSSNMMIKINNGAAQNCLRYISEVANCSNTYKLNRLPNKSAQISYNPAFEIVKKNIYDLSLTTSAVIYDDNMYTDSVVATSDVIYDNSLNFKPTDRDEAKVVVKEFNIIPYVRELRNTPARLSMLCKFSNSSQSQLIMNCSPKCSRAGYMLAGESVTDSNMPRAWVATYLDSNAHCVAMCICGTTDPRVLTYTFLRYVNNGAPHPDVYYPLVKSLAIKNQGTGAITTEKNYEIKLSITGAIGNVLSSCSLMCNTDYNGAGSNCAPRLWIFANNPTIKTRIDDLGNTVLDSDIDIRQFKNNLDLIYSDIVDGYPYYLNNDIYYLTGGDNYISNWLINRTDSPSSLMIVVA